jgi:hypothetical protein
MDANEHIENLKIKAMVTTKTHEMRVALRAIENRVNHALARNSQAPCGYSSQHEIWQHLSHVRELIMLAQELLPEEKGG